MQSRFLMRLAGVGIKGLASSAARRSYRRGAMAKAAAAFIVSWHGFLAKAASRATFSRLQPLEIWHRAIGAGLSGMAATDATSGVKASVRMNSSHGAAGAFPWS